MYVFMSICFLLLLKKSNGASAPKDTPNKMHLLHFDYFHLFPSFYVVDETKFIAKLILRPKKLNKK
jgi:hypothetical protein